MNVKDKHKLNYEEAKLKLVKQQFEDLKAKQTESEQTKKELLDSI